MLHHIRIRFRNAQGTQKINKKKKNVKRNSEWIETNCHGSPVARTKMTFFKIDVCLIVRFAFFASHY